MTTSNASVSSRPGDVSFNSWLAQSSILIVDDEPGMRNFLTRTLVSRCKHVAEAADVSTAARLLEEEHYDLVLLDNIMPGKRGVDWLLELRDSGFFGEVILITAFADLDTAIQALRAGASDFLLKPFRSNQILNAIARCLDRSQLRRENFVLRRELQKLPSSERNAGRLVGESEAMRHVREMVGRLAPLPTTVLITGESGTGKEVTARALHMQSPRAGKPFVPVNCAAIPPDIIESELFGHLKGAFSGAASSREGLFFYAQDGTLFLDEIGELPPALQSKLLRVIEDKRVRPVGAEREMPVDVRLIAATNADLEDAVAKGRMRHDLFYRLNVMNIRLPPLRERPEDIAPLVRLFMEQLSRQLAVEPIEVEDDVLAVLEQYSWPGNAREVRNVVERSLILGKFPTDIITRGNEPGPVRSEALKELEKSHMLGVLAAVGGNRAEAARRLGISRKTLDRKCAAWNV